MIEKFFIGLIGTSVAGGFSIFVFCCLSWILRKRYGARSRKNGWILFAVCLLLPLNLLPLPYTHTIQLPNLVLQESTESASNMARDVPQSEQKTNTEVPAIHNKAYGAKISTERILFLFWSAGMLILTVYHLTAYRKLCRKVKRWSHDFQNETVQKTAADITVEIGLKKIPKLRIIEKDGPFTMGITKTIVCIPNEDFLEKDLYIEGATIFEINGKTMVRLIQLLPEEDDETVNVIDASYRGGRMVY